MEDLQVEPERVVVRLTGAERRRGRALAAGLAAFGLVLGPGYAGLARSGWFLALAVLPVIAVGVLRTWRWAGSSLEVDAVGLHVRSTRSRDLPWADVAALTVEVPPDPTARHHLVVETTSAEILPLHATRRHPEAFAEVRQAVESHRPPGNGL